MICNLYTEAVNGQGKSFEIHSEISENLWAELNFLPLHSTGAIPTHELGHIADTYTVEVTDDRTLQRTRCNGKLKGRLSICIVIQTIKQAADTVHDLDLILVGQMCCPLCIQKRRPVIDGAEMLFRRVVAIAFRSYFAASSLATST